MTNRNLFLKDLGLSLKAHYHDVFGTRASQRNALHQLLELRNKRYPAGHASIGEVKEQLALSYLAWSADDLRMAEKFAQEAEDILVATGRRGRNSWRVADMIHVRSQVKQRFGQSLLALELGEDALAIYNRTRMISWQRARLMQSLVELHYAVGDKARAKKLETEVAILRSVLNSRSARHRY